jgi:hypothetical protein
MLPNGVPISFALKNIFPISNYQNVFFCEASIKKYGAIDTTLIFTQTKPYLMNNCQLHDFSCFLVTSTHLKVDFPKLI